MTACVTGAGATDLERPGTPGCPLAQLRALRQPELLGAEHRLHAAERNGGATARPGLWQPGSTARSSAASSRPKGYLSGSSFKVVKIESEESSR